MSLEELYEHIDWRMNPEDERARERFERIAEFFGSISDVLPSGGRVLDLCAGTGIAGAALAKVTEARSLTLLDARRIDRDSAEKWLELARLKPELRLVQGDAREVGELVDEHDVVVLWGLTMPHFDPFDAVRLFAGVARVLGENGVFLIEDMDRVYWVMYRAGYKRFLVEGRKGDRTIASMHEGYDFVGGTFRRGYYVLPGFRKVGTVDFHYWDISTQLALGRIFFGEYGLVKREDHGIAGVGDVLIFKKPKGDVARLVAEDFGAPHSE
ncbi:class I SAM-dependent methyltransferase [Thermococcus celer]|uniref:SAM-dependent methyltransferase n=1 Tax=Thermococcus celer Vu 13 = JCM 8558 TaxID=1293037 RepID=A0A218P2U9_THECE|nr:class I SAM-dependent methyltransferase [Thermococcus celer]ASI99242.1 SAM-dependent methyltransferase [Thermococcus celer Vu 13 = JCM 8558]